MVCSFLHIRQRHELKRLTTIERHLNQHQGGSKPLPKWELDVCWHHYLLINQAIISLAVDIERYSALWTLSLTVYLSGFICLQCYVVYIVFFIRSVSLASKFLFLYGLIEIEAFQFLLIHICAKVAKTNGAIEKVNQKLCILFSRLYLRGNMGSSRLRTIDLQGLLKVMILLVFCF